MARFALLALLIAGQLAVAQPLLFQPREIDRKVPGCGDAQDGCVHAELDWADAISGTEPLRGRINAAVLAFLGGKLTPEEYAAGFVRSYQDAPKHLLNERWYVWKKVKLLRAMPPVISLECSQSSFTGGAHPSSDTTFLNFDAHTGEKATLADIVIDGAMPSLTQVAEQQFRKARELMPTADLKDAGFIFFKGDRFFVNDNWGVANDSLIFYYNAYEAAPYYMGPTEVKIPFEAIRDLLRPGLAN